MGTPSKAPPAPESTERESGTQTLLSGRFEILRPLGEGGFGTVYEALDRASGERVALKLLTRMNAEALLRFKREFRALQGTEHRNLIHLDELFEDEGRWFFTMELLAGEDLLSYVTAGTREWRPVARGSIFPPSVAPTQPPRPRRYDETRLRSVLVQLAQGLSTLHGAGMVHRDLKPSNVWVTPTGRVVILDFGLVADSLTEGDDEIFGTVEYMAPEQASQQPLTPATDWYAVGSMLFEALAGRLPYRGGAVHVMLRKQRDEAPRLSDLDVGAPEDLAELCTRLLAIDPAERPDAASVLRSLGVTGAPTEGSISTNGTRHTQAARFVGRERELERLHDAFLRACQGELAIGFVHGESGVGKSALMAQLTRQIGDERPEALMLRARCYENETVPYKALDGIVDMLSRYLRSLSGAECEGLLPRHVGLLANMFPVLGRVPAIQQMVRQVPRQADRVSIRDLAFASLRELLGRLATRLPLVLEVDDFQWADEESLSLLSKLLRAPNPPPLLCLLTGRSPDECESVVAAGIQHVLQHDPRHLRIALGELAESEAKELAARLLKSPDQARVQQLVTEAGGHPMFLEVLAGRGSGAEVDTGGALDEALGDRVRRLSPQSRRLLELTAIAGVPIARSALAAAAGLSLNALGREVSALQIGRLVRTGRGGASENVEVYHNRIRVAVLGEMDDAACAHAHRALAKALEANEHADPERLATHWHRAGNEQNAAQRAFVAAEMALESLAFYKAVRLYRWSLELWSDNPERGRILSQLAESLSHAGRASEAADAFKEAAEFAKGIEANDLLKRSAEHLIQCGRLEEGLELTARVLEGLGLSLPSQAGAVAKLTWLIPRRKLRGNDFTPRRAQEIPHEELARIDTLWALGSALGPRDALLSAVLVTQQALRALAAGEPSRVARALATDALVAHVIGSASNVDLMVERARQLASDSDDAHVHAFIDMVDGMARMWGGDCMAAYTALSRANATFAERTTDMSWLQMQSRQTWLTPTLWQGKIAVLREEFPSIVQSAQERGDKLAPNMVALFGAAAYHLSMDNTDLALGESTAALSQLQPRPNDVTDLQGLLVRLNVEAYGGEPGGYEILLGDWDRIRRARRLRLGMHGAVFHYHYGTGRLRTPDTSAVRAALASSKFILKLPHPMLHGFGYLLRAQCRLAQGDAPAAARDANEAAQRAEAAGLELLAGRARMLGSRLDPTSKQAGQHRMLVALSKQNVCDPERFLQAFVPLADEFR